MYIVSYIYSCNTSYVEFWRNEVNALSLHRLNSKLYILKSAIQLIRLSELRIRRRWVFRVFIITHKTGVCAYTAESQYYYYYYSYYKRIHRGACTNERAHMIIIMILGAEGKHWRRNSHLTAESFRPTGFFNTAK